MAPVHEKHPRLSKHKVTWTLDSEKGNESALGAEGKQGQRATARENVRAQGCRRPAGTSLGSGPASGVIHMAAAAHGRPRHDSHHL